MILLIALLMVSFIGVTRLIKDSEDLTAQILTAAGCGIFIIFITALGSAHIDAKSNVEKYNQNVIFIAEHKNTDNKYLQSQIQEIILKDNKIISVHKQFQGDMFIGIFYPSKIANLRKHEDSGEIK